MTPSTPHPRPPRSRLLAAGAFLTAIGLVAALAPLALADTITINDVGTGSDVSRYVGETGAQARIKLVQVDGTDLHGCNVDATHPAIISLQSSRPAKVSLASSSVSIGACGVDHDVAYSILGGAVGDEIVIYANYTSGGLGPSTTPTRSPLYTRDAFKVTIVAAPVAADTSAPEIALALAPAAPDGTNGWYRTVVTFDWSVWDNQSAVSSASGCDDETIRADTAGTTRTCVAASAGGTNSSTSATIRLDATPPTVGLVDGPADGGSYYWGFVPAAPTCSASDATSGVTSAGCAVSGYGASIGTHTVQANATDDAGNEDVDRATYTVLAWSGLGFYAPANDTLNTVKSGATVPLKFEIFAGTTEITDKSTLVFRAVKIATCAGGQEDSIEVVTSGHTVLRYDETGGQFVQNWQTPSKMAGACYKVSVSGGGLVAPIVADFKLK